MSKKRNDKESMICLTSKPGLSFFIYRIQIKEKCFTEKKLIKEKCRGVQDGTIKNGLHNVNKKAS